ncbi:leucyl/phenylalanyl-tRNA--protein transferase [Sporichthya polymorpha]|uniref:leucyl/phenylalanyl-tRNA--protein transferase n=1 Tax=Sporichthya polymorpha TaxID=35751 RepID=UPI000360B0D3|nr:leucyl/phenylalanyl-tRNA--protein transferase [Sporichthya polymorpha]
MPVEPEPTPWAFPPVEVADPLGLVGVGADLEPGTLLAAYRSGIFPMPESRRGPMGWWSPDPRGVLPVDGVHVSRSLRRTRRRFTITVNSAFDEVVAACADPRRPHGWISPALRGAYRRLHDLGWAHSVEVRTADGALAGGLFGLAIGGFFAGESMFHRVTDASKAAVAAVGELLAAGDGPAAQRLFDVQWTTDHLRTLGSVDVPRPEYLRRLERALELPLPPAFDDGVRAPAPALGLDGT